MHADVEGVLYSAFGRGAHIGTANSHPNFVVVVPIFIGIVDYIIGIASLGGHNPKASSKHVQRPVPPVDLPFD